MSIRKKKKKNEISFLKSSLSFSLNNLFHYAAIWFKGDVVES